MLVCKLCAAIVSMAALSVSAQVEVEDRSLGFSTEAALSQNANPANQSNAPVNNAAELYYRMQVLQQEVLQMRGIIDEQAHEIKKLKQQRLDDYLEIDRRLSKLGSGGGGARQSMPQNQAFDPNPQTPGLASNSSQGGAAPAPENELKIYRSAIDLVLKQQNYDKALVELHAYLGQYPKGRYAANAEYWLGEIYLLKNDLEQSRQWFSQLLTDFPRHRKAPDAKFKLGKVYHLLGDKVTAKKLLEEVANTDSSAAKLAKDYLVANFQS